MEIGALCFIAGDTGAPAECHRAMTEERQRVFSRISELAAAGDPVGVELEAEFSTPRNILGGDGEDA